MNQNLTQTICQKSRYVLLLLVLLFYSYSVKSQVTIGDNLSPQDFSILEIVSNSKGGLRLPQLTTAERNAITTTSFKANSLAEGLSIFNLTTKCFEYWNGTRWVSLCKGNANITFTDDSGNTVDPFETSFACEGETRGPYTAHDTEACTSVPEPFHFIILVGNAYTSVNVVDRTTGKIQITMTRNTTPIIRHAVLRVTNSCTSEYQEFLITQEGCADICQPDVAKPIISVSNSGDICSSGAVYMHITNPVSGANYVWTLDGFEISNYTGKTYCIATKSGTYKVYVGGIGCDTNASDPIAVTVNPNNTAPSPVSNITASNNGVICGTGSVKLTAYGVPSGATLTWYKNGQKTSKTGNPITLISGDEGEWFAVMQSGICTSEPSNTIPVTYEETTPLVDPVITVNGVALSSATFCSGGSNTLTVTNTSSYTTGVTINWFIDSDFIGSGTSITIATPTSDSFMLRCVVHDNTSTSCDAEVIYEETVSGTAPARPSIIGSPFICDATPALLSTAASGSSYQWYKDGVKISGANTNTYSATEIGGYQVQVIDAGGCLSSLSATVNVKLSSVPTVAFNSSSLVEVGLSTTYTYNVTSAGNPTSYSWSILGGGDAVLLDGSNPNSANTTTTSPSIRITSPSTAKTFNLGCIASNTCGNSARAAIDITSKSECTPVSVANIQMSPTGNIMAGASVSMSVTASGTAPYTYQWMLGGTLISGATSSTYSIGSATTANSGTYSVQVTGCDSSTATSTAGSINVVTIPPTDGSGKITGQDCFDINQSNYNTACGLKANRQTADFTQTYTYTFTNSGTGNKNLRWVIEELPSGAIIDYSASTITDTPEILANGGTYKIVIKYKESLMVDAKETTDANPYKVNIYAVYTTASNVEQKASLTVLIKDCQCACYAKNISGGTYYFMCHNLGANQNLDPFTYSTGIIGDLYQWGRKADGHQKRTSSYSWTLSTTTTPNHPNFILVETGADVPSGDWMSNATRPNLYNRWGNGTDTAVNPGKGPTDPCPTGWKVPSASQWKTIISSETGGVAQTPSGATANTWTWTGNGFKVGDRLYLPAAGYRYMGDGSLMRVGLSGAYWSSSVNDVTSYYLSFDKTRLQVINGKSRAAGYSVRCIKE